MGLECMCLDEAAGAALHREPAHRPEMKADMGALHSVARRSPLWPSSGHGCGLQGSPPGPAWTHEDCCRLASQVG